MDSQGFREFSRLIMGLGCRVGGPTVGVLITARVPKDISPVWGAEAEAKDFVRARWILKILRDLRYRIPWEV